MKYVYRWLNLIRSIFMLSPLIVGYALCMSLRHAADGIEWIYQDRAWSKWLIRKEERR